RRIEGKVMDNSSTPVVFITAEEATYLPLDRRVAWATFVVEAVLRRCSPHLRSSYHLQEAVDYTWGVAATGSDEGPRRSQIGQGIDDSYAEAEAEGYPQYFFRMALCLLDEIEFGTGHNACRAIDHASVAYAYLAGYRLGIDIGDPALPQAVAE